MVKGDVLEELRADNPVPEELAPPPVERLLARLSEEQVSDRRKPLGSRRALAIGPLLVSIAVIVAIAVGALALLHAARKPTSGATPSLAHGGRVRVWVANGNNGQDVTNGGVAGRGHFHATGAISDRGTVVTYRTLKGALIKLRYVTTGAKGTITYLVKINPSKGTSRWTIRSATGRYKGLHGRGTETENADYTISILTGTIRPASRWPDAAEYNGLATYIRIHNQCATDGRSCAVFGGPTG
jgi:hypothetical protein